MYCYEIQKDIKNDSLIIGDFDKYVEFFAYISFLNYGKYDENIFKELIEDIHEFIPRRKYRGKDNKFWK